jgi:glutaredoxin 3
MKPVTIYTTPFCPYCRRAKSLLDRKGIAYNEIDVSKAPERRAEMVRRAAGRYTVPQVFVGDTHVGGSDDLHALEARGGLDALLGR